MAKVAWELLGDGKWSELNKGRWAICNWNWESGVYEDQMNGDGDPWTAIYVRSYVEVSYHHFATHAEATAYVRSQIAKTQSA